MKEVDVMIKVRAVLLIGLCSSWLSCMAQTAFTTLPNWLIDSMEYEVRLGRQCTEVMKAQANEIEKLGAELMHTNKALELKQSETQTLENLLSNSKEQGRVDKMQADLNLNTEKKKTKKWKKITFTVILIWVAKEGLNALN